MGCGSSKTTMVQDSVGGAVQSPPVGDKLDNAANSNSSVSMHQAHGTLHQHSHSDHSLLSSHDVRSSSAGGTWRVQSPVLQSNGSGGSESDHQSTRRANIKDHLDNELLLGTHSSDSGKHYHNFSDNVEKECTFPEHTSEVCLTEETEALDASHNLETHIKDTPQLGTTHYVIDTHCSSLTGEMKPQAGENQMVVLGLESAAYETNKYCTPASGSLDERKRHNVNVHTTYRHPNQTQLHSALKNAHSLSPSPRIQKLQFELGFIDNVTSSIDAEWEPSGCETALEEIGDFLSFPRPYFPPLQ